MVYRLGCRTPYSPDTPHAQRRERTPPPPRAACAASRPSARRPSRELHRGRAIEVGRAGKGRAGSGPRSGGRPGLSAPSRPAWCAVSWRARGEHLKAHGSRDEAHRRNEPSLSRWPLLCRPGTTPRQAGPSRSRRRPSRCRIARPSASKEPAACARAPNEAPANVPPPPPPRRWALWAALSR